MPDIFETSSDVPRANQLSERGVIALIKEELGSVTRPSPNGMGDDCAVVAPPIRGHVLMTTDSVTYGRHFDAKVTPSDVGAKLLKRNVSDIAAMGGTPRYAL